MAPPGLFEILYDLFRTVAGAQEFRREPSGAYEAIDLGAEAGNRDSRYPPVLLKQRNQVSDSPGVEGGGVELVS